MTLKGRPESGAQPVGRRLDVLRVLTEATAPMTIAAIAEELHIHPNTVRLHLDVLVPQGRVEHVVPDHRRPGRPPLLFRAVPRMDPTGPRHYRLLAEILTASIAAGPDPGARAAEAGRVWGRQLAPSFGAHRAGKGKPIERLVELLQDLGFAPERRRARGRSQIGLRHCPFLELAEPQGQVVCPVHLGLMQGAMETWGAEVTVERLEAFVEPDLCLAHLGPAGARR